MDKETFIRLYEQSGGLRQNGERLWKKYELERSAPALAEENIMLRALLRDARYVIELTGRGLGLSVDGRTISVTMLLAQIDAALAGAEGGQP